MSIFKKKNACEICKSKEVLKFNVFKILKSTNQPLKLGDQPSLSGNLGIAFSDVNKFNPNGTLYFYETAESNSIHYLCSLKCAFDFAVETNSLVLYPDPDKQGGIRAIFPDLLKINENLGLPEESKYRGQPAGNF